MITQRIIQIAEILDESDGSTKDLLVKFVSLSFWYGAFPRVRKPDHCTFVILFLKELCKELSGSADFFGRWFVAIFTFDTLIKTMFDLPNKLKNKL